MLYVLNWTDDDGSHSVYSTKTEDLWDVYYVLRKDLEGRGGGSMSMNNQNGFPLDPEKGRHCPAKLKRVDGKLEADYDPIIVNKSN